MRALAARGAVCVCGVCAVAVGWLWLRCPRAPPVIGGYIFTCTLLGLWLLGSSSPAPWLFSSCACPAAHSHLHRHPCSSPLPPPPLLLPPPKLPPLLLPPPFRIAFDTTDTCLLLLHPCASTVSHVSWPGELSGSDRASVSLVTSDDSRAAAFGSVRMTTRVRTHAELSPVALASQPSREWVG